MVWMILLVVVPAADQLLYSAVEAEELTIA